MSTSIEIALKSPLLDDCVNAWELFSGTFRESSNALVVYHGDIDGLTAAAYVCETLSGMGHNYQTKVVQGCDYDFEFLPKILREDHSHIIFLDVSIENHRSSVTLLNACETKKIFIYDHHVDRETQQFGSHVSYNNPTPHGLSNTGYPIPSFFFAMRLADAAGLQFPLWLVTAALFVDGDAEFFPNDARELLSVLGQTVIGTLHDAFRKSQLGNLGNLIAADFSHSDSESASLALIRSVARGEIRSPTEYLTYLEHDIGAVAKRISREKTKYVDELIGALESPEAPTTSPACVFIYIDAKHIVSGPVASIVRGRFPRNIIITYVIENEKGLFELRTGSDSSICLPDELKVVAESVRLLNFGGHRNAAGASVRESDIPSFIQATATHFRILGYEAIEYDVSTHIFRRDI